MTGSAFTLPVAADDRKPVVKTVASDAVANWNRITAMLSLLLVLS
jgi:hypothetical protein